MGIDAWVTLAVLLLVLGALMRTRRAPDMILLGGLTLLLVVPVPGGEGGWRFGVLSPARALSGFANEGLITIAALFVMAAGLRETGATTWIAHRVLGRPKGLGAAQLRLMAPTAVMSAFINNTPLVAMMIPAVDEWSKRTRISVSKLLIPLSYASILGGTCSLIGTSTNLIVYGWVLDRSEGSVGIGMFEIAWVGLPCAALGVGFVLLTSRWLLPERRSVFSANGDAREYTVEMLVEPGSPLAGQTIEQAGLRHLPGLYLVEIIRNDQVLPAVGPHVVLHEEDRLVFAGVVDSVKDLRRIRGLKPATNQVYKIQEPHGNRQLIEAVVSDTCPLVGRSIRAGRFRSRYNAAVIAVARNGERIRGKKIGDIVLQPGDTLLLEARANFAEQHRDSRDFYLVSSVADSTPPRHERAPVALAILAALVVSVATGWLSMLQAAMAAGVGLILTRCCTATVARRNIDLQLLLVIGAALGLGKAMQDSGLAEAIATEVIGLAGSSPFAALAAIYLLTTLFTSVITNNAAAVLILPIASATAERLGVSFMPFIFAIMVSASACFATPIAYQTNLMVYGPGGYRFSDYVRIGGPLTLLVMIVALTLIPLLWPL